MRKRSLFLIATLTVASLVGCDRQQATPIVVNPVTPPPATVAVPGPAGPQGAPGATGTTGATGQTGEGAKVIVITPPASAPTN